MHAHLRHHPLGCASGSNWRIATLLTGSVCVQGTNDVTHDRWRAYADPNGKIIEAIFNISDLVQQYAPNATILIAAPIITNNINDANDKERQDAFAARVHNLSSDVEKRRYIVGDMMEALTGNDLREDGCVARTHTPRLM